MPARTNRFPSTSNFASWAAGIRKAVQTAEAKEARQNDLRPEETAYGVLRVECYRYLQKVKRDDIVDQLRAHVEAQAPGRWHRHPGTDADWVLRLLESNPRKNWITPPRRARIVLELNFADRCRVGPSWLLPFLYECGNHELIKLAMDAVRPPNWVWKYHRASRIRTRKAPQSRLDGW